MNLLTPKLVLLRAADIVDNGWCQGNQALARHTEAELEPFRKEGLDPKEWFIVQPNDPRAERFCASGAIYRAIYRAICELGQPNTTDELESCSDLSGYISSACARAIGISCFWFFNDSDDVTQPMVSAKLRWLAEEVK